MDKEYLDWDIRTDKKKRENYENLQSRFSVNDKILGLAALCRSGNSTDEELIRIMNNILNELPKHPDQRLYFDTIVTSYPRLDKLRKELDDKYRADTKTRSE